MSSKNLTFKLIMDGDSKGLVSAAKQSESVTTKVFETIKNEAKKVKIDGLINELNQATKEVAGLGDKSAVSANQIREMSMKSQQMVGALKSELVGAQAELVRLSQAKASPSDIQTAVNRVAELKASILSVNASFGAFESTATDAMSGVDKVTSKTIAKVQKFTSVDLTGFVSEAQDATRAIESMGDGAIVSTKDIERIGKQGATAIDSLERELLAASSQLKALSQSADAVSLKEFNAATAKVNGLEDALGLTKTQMHQFNQVAQQATPIVDNLDQSLGKANQELKETETTSQRVSGEIKGLKTGFTALTSALAALGIGTSAMEIAQTADEYKNLSGRIRIAIGDHGNLQKAMDDVKNVAVATNSDLTATGDLYSRLTKIGQEMKWPQEQALALTETINKAIQVGGGSATSTEAALTQMQQALSSGQLRGDEFNSMVEQSPRLTQAMADGLGVTTGKLRELAGEGKLTTDVVTKALLSQSEKISAEYAKFPATIGAAIENLKTAWTVYIGEADAANGVSTKVAEALKYVAENLDMIVSTLTLAGQAFIAYKALNIASVFLDKAVGVRAASVAITQETALVVANTQAQLANAAATRGAAVAKTQLATNSATVTTSVVATGGSIMNLVGRLGALGIAVTALGILVPTVIEPLGTAIGEGAAKLMGYGDAIEKLDRQLANEAAQVKAAAEVKASFAKASEDATAKTHGLTTESKKLITEFDALIKKGEETKDALEKVASAMRFDSTKGINDSVTALNLLKEQGKITADELQAKLGQALSGKDLLVFQTNAQAAFAGTAQEAAKSAAVTEAVMKAALGRTGLETQQLKGSFSSTFQSASNDVQIVIDNLDTYKAQGVDTGLALSANLNNAIDTAQTGAELDYAKGKLVEYGKQGLITGEQVALGLSKIEQKIGQLPDILNPAQAAFAAMGVKTQEQLDLAAQSAQANFDVISKSGQATADGIQQAYKNMLDATIATGDKAKVAMAQAKASSLGLEVQLDATGKATVAKLGEIQEAAQATQRSVSQVSRTETPSNPTGGASDSLAGQDYWEEFKAKRAKINEASQTRLNDSKSGALSRPLGLSAISNSAPITPQAEIANMAPMIASSFDIQEIETMQPTEKKVLELQSGGKAAELQGTPEAVDSVEEMLREFEMLKRSM